MSKPTCPNCDVWHTGPCEGRKGEAVNDRAIEAAKRMRQTYIVTGDKWFRLGAEQLEAANKEFERGKDIGRAIGWDAAKRDTSASLGLNGNQQRTEPGNG